MPITLNEMSRNQESVAAVCQQRIRERSSSCLFLLLPEGKLLSPSFINQRNTFHLTLNYVLYLSRNAYESMHLY